jgi:mannan endo-1,4-beta-mannosidase
MLIICITAISKSQDFKTLDYIKSISGSKTIAGQHNREPNSAPATWTDSIYAATGKYPGLWSGDFLFQADNIANRWVMIHEAKKQWDKGSLVQIMLHTCPPVYGEPCEWEGGVLSHLSDSLWTELITDGTRLNNNWKNRLDTISVYLQYLKENGVEVIFRPLHEMNQKLFWWGGRPGPNGTAKLYRITHDYLTKTKGLNNLIWIWDMQDIDSSWAAYNPGNEYWDILAFDVYSNGYNKNWYNYVLSIAGNRPVAIGECAKLPTAEILASEQRYVFFMAWSELAFTTNTIEQIKALYNSPNVITLDKMPGWKK